MDATSLFANDNVLTFPNRKSVTFDFKVSKVELMNNMVIAVLAIPSPAPENNNVVAYSTDGVFIWRIDTSTKDFFFGQPYCPFVDIDTADHHGHPDQVMLYNWCTCALRINPATGEILERYQTH